MRHNPMKDSKAQNIMRKVCRDVHIEPRLLQITGSKFERIVNTAHCRGQGKTRGPT